MLKNWNCVSSDFLQIVKYRFPAPTTHIKHKSIICSEFLIIQLVRTESHFEVTNTTLPHCIFFLFLMNVYSCKLQVNCKKVVVFFLNKIRSLYMMIWYSANCNLNYVPLRVRLIFVELMIHQQMTIKS